MLASWLGFGGYLETLRLQAKKKKGLTRRRGAEEEAKPSLRGSAPRESSHAEGNNHNREDTQKTVNRQEAVGG